MKSVCAVTVLVLTSGVEQAAPDEVPRPAKLSFGYLVGAPTLGITGYAIQELQLTDEHTEMFEASLTRYRNGLYHEFLDTLRHSNPKPWDIKDHYDAWVKSDVEKIA